MKLADAPAGAPDAPAASAGTPGANPGAPAPPDHCGGPPAGPEPDPKPQYDHHHHHTGHHGHYSHHHHHRRRHEPCMDPSVSHAPDAAGAMPLADGGGRLAWWLFRPPPTTKPAGRVLVIWGAFATARHFDDVAAELRDAHGFEVLCYHHRGVAASGPCRLDRPQSSALLAADALALIDHVWGPECAVHLYGASMGGMVAQELAAALARQGRLASLAISVSSRGLGATHRLPLLAALLHSRAAVWVLRQWYGAHRSPAALVRRLMRGVFAPDFLALRHPASGRPMREHYARWWGERFGELFTFGDANTIACHTAVIATHWLSDAKAALLRGCGAPILVQVSEGDLLIAPASQRALAAALGARVLSYKIGHMGVAPVAARFRGALAEHWGAAEVLARARGAPAP